MRSSILNITITSIVIVSLTSGTRQGQTRSLAPTLTTPDVLHFPPRDDISQDGTLQSLAMSMIYPG